MSTLFSAQFLLNRTHVCTHPHRWHTNFPSQPPNQITPPPTADTQRQITAGPYPKARNSEEGVVVRELLDHCLDLVVGLERLLALVAPDSGALVAPEGQGSVAVVR